MISTFVNEEHTDWNELLPYVTMAYRPTEHETIGFSPNLLMLGRQTSTPLDNAFEMPSSVKSVPASQWVWELQERLESAHKVVIQQTGKYLDRKLSYEAFEPGDSVYIFFLSEIAAALPN